MRLKAAQKFLKDGDKVARNHVFSACNDFREFGGLMFKCYLLVLPAGKNHSELKRP